MAEASAGSPGASRRRRRSLRQPCRQEVFPLDMKMSGTRIFLAGGIMLVFVEECLYNDL